MTASPCCRISNRLRRSPRCAPARRRSSRRSIPPNRRRSSPRATSSTKSDAYFLTSGDKIRCFFEEEAFDGAGALRQPKELSINKIGHAMHDLDPVFAHFSRDPRLHDVALELGLAEPRVLQSDVHLQAAADRRRGALAPRRDVLRHRSDQRDDTVVRARTRGPQQRLFVGAARRTPHAAARALRRRQRGRAAGARRSHAVAVRRRRGAGRGRRRHARRHARTAPHYSAPNRSAASRHAYTLHVVDARTRYSPANWLQRDAALPARGFL